jgi:hypothetical protein
MKKRETKPVLATPEQQSAQHSTESNTIIQYQCSPVSAMAANRASQTSSATPHNQSTALLSR